MGLETVELVISWEQEFGITIPNSVASTLITPAQASDAIECLLNSSGKPRDRSAIEAIVRTTTLEISGMNPDDYRIDGRFVQDFGLD
jgi:hypothetical protein